MSRPAPQTKERKDTQRPISESNYTILIGGYIHRDVNKYNKTKLFIMIYCKEIIGNNPAFFSLRAAHRDAGLGQTASWKKNHKTS